MPKIELEIPDYDKNTGLQYSWEDGFEISTGLQDNAVISCVAMGFGDLRITKQNDHTNNITKNRITFS